MWRSVAEPVQLAVELAVQAECRAVDRGGTKDVENVGIYLHGWSS
ncbi:hypothetical protein [Streptomyces achromogenes]|nr:hypothetical protein [Streptomyces achromogenes]